VDRIIPVGERALWWLRHYLNGVRPELLVRADCKALFRALTASGITMAVMPYLREAGTEKGSCHLFRHVMATQMRKAGTATGALAGKNAVESNFLINTDSDRLDKAVEKIKQGDRSLATANDMIKLENANKHSDALMDKFRRDPSSLSESERTELNTYVRVYAAEMQSVYGADKAKQMVQNLISYPGYERNPDNAVLNQAQSIVNTWGYHKSNASIGDSPLIFGSSVLGTTIREGMAVNAAMGTAVNTGVQLNGNEPFSYVDAIMAGGIGSNNRQGLEGISWNEYGSCGDR